ncbi:LysR family transcriptional regulator [Phaeobacter gallaeciensis]|uniref:LysR family transcriptional regulator n=1 Tax=Phaeobacter gallaeciensis TaxID=60890 RepID=UPI00237F42ED|nr:LysR family transcriptional regulator [Phaeobacter gallaeciensis]MDE4305837.1 LysR family transcriptional regulator [Phaeobacter gallaeciensis]MDE4310182.1 LysR family transcriptional regulator [Phaeobacter gallaeciensis]MDE4314694.1 LysR family transcriptional regulator [Phaeobacter gallaeciensis]MDE4319085.1 LysR family transcriptional regulator [Phaeobacter gallaeciensis]MDE4323587.1 LysR family transcriptional regulator [Phaeobacter gallaeciensis]
MQITAFRYFLAVAESGSIRQAADDLHVSASALSRQMQNLEHSFKVALFERRSSGMHLTEEGRILAQHMRRTLREMELAQARIDDVQSLATGRIRFATIEGVVQSWLFSAITAFQKDFPHILFSGEVMGSEAVIAALKADKVDFGIAIQTDPDLDHDPMIDIILRIETRYKAVMAPCHDLAGYDNLCLNDLGSTPLAMLGASFQTRRQLDSAAVRQGIALNIAFELNHIELLKRYVLETAGLTVLPDYAVGSEEMNGGPVVADIDLGDIPGDSTILCVQRGRRLTRAAEEFVARLQVQIPRHAHTLPESQP